MLPYYLSFRAPPLILLFFPKEGIRKLSTRFQTLIAFRGGRWKDRKKEWLHFSCLSKVGTMKLKLIPIFKDRY